MTTASPAPNVAPKPGAHTDGPWKASDLPEGGCFEVETADGAFYIGSCPFGDPSVEPEVPSFSQARANARMFASAPALAAENARLIALVGELREALEAARALAVVCIASGCYSRFEIAEMGRATKPTFDRALASKASAS